MRQKSIRRGTTGSRAVGAVVLLYGVALAIPAAELAWLGGSSGFLLTAVGTAVAGLLLALQRREGALLYLLVFAATTLWSISVVGTRLALLLPRIWIAVLLGIAVLIVDRVRSRSVP